MSEIEKATFIKAATDMGTSAPVFCKCFSASNVKRATLYITARGTWNAKINGKHIDGYVMAPGWTQYNERIQYDEIDITEFLEEENKIEIGVGLGWFFLECYETKNSDVAVKAAIIIEQYDGTTQKIYTDNSWNYCSGHTLYDNIYNGETYDANLEITPIGKAKVTQSYTLSLVPRQGEAIKEFERILARQLIITPKNEVVIDFGQNMTGYVEFIAEGKKGDTLIITHAETLDKDGNFYNDNYRSAKNEIRFICDGNKHCFKPHYTFQGFRYIKLEGFGSKPDISAFTAVVVHSNIKRTGHFSCSDENINALYHNIIWGQKSNFLDVPTDCPQRDERLGWTGDAEVFVRTASYNFDVEKFFVKWLADMAISQTDDGRIPHVVPCIQWWKKKDGTSSAAWADAAVICPWQIYMTYGNKQIIENQFDCMKKWVDYINGVSKDYLWLGGEHFGDWLGLDAEEGSYVGATSKDYIASCFFAYSCSLLIKAGKVIDKDMSYYEQLYKNITESINNSYTDENGNITVNTQTACVLALYFDICKNKAAVAKQLNLLIEECGHLKTGFVGTPYLLHALSENGYAKTAYSLLLRRDYPSWLYPLSKGATTMWEHWDGIKPDGSMWSRDMNSYNHYAYGAVYDWMFEVMAGIKPDENNPGFAHFKICPITDNRLSFAEASLETKHGTVKSGWKRVNGVIAYSFTVPDGCTAEFCVNGSSTVFNSGSYCVEVKEG